MRAGIIYMISHKETGKSYIGKTERKNWKARIKEHFKGQSIGTPLIHYAMKKHGADAFQWFVLYKDVPNNAIDALEKACIQDYNTQHPNGYNLKEGGDGGSHSPDTRQKIANSHLGKKFTDKHKENLSKAKRGANSYHYGKRGPGTPNYGNTHTVETREKMSRSQRGKKRSKETRERMSKARTGIVFSDKTREKMSLNHHRRYPDKIKNKAIHLYLNTPLTGKEVAEIINSEFNTNMNPKTIVKWCMAIRKKEI